MYQFNYQKIKEIVAKHMINIEQDTIIGLSTPSGLGAVGIVRLSGARALEFSLKLFFSSKIDKNNIVANHMYLGNVSANGVKDKALMCYFASPKSYSGEDVVEFFCHGGTVVLNAVIEAAIKLGARLAFNGEFSRRAFLNGKMSLSEIEGTSDLINAESEAENNLAYSLLKGHLTKKVSYLQEKLTNALTYIEAAFDYPEEETPVFDKKRIESELKEVVFELVALKDSYKSGRQIVEGVTVAIVGEPNVGKSSILNAILGEDKAIVTEIAGTTRDVMEAKYVFKGLKFNLCDTAGIRETAEVVEKIGVERALTVLSSAQIVVLVVTAKEKEQAETEIKNLTRQYNIDDKTKNLLVVLNKVDLCDAEIKNNQISGYNVVYLSAKDNINVDKLKEMVYDIAVQKKVVSTENFAITNLRHKSAIDNALNAVNSAISSVWDMPYDCIACDIKECWDYLGEITGVTCSEEIINSIFSKLCLGK